MRHGPKVFIIKLWWKDKKKISVTGDLNINLQENVLSKFGLNDTDVHLQILDNDVGEYIDLDSDEDDMTKAKTNLTWGMSNYLPKRPDSEDSESIKLHKTWFKQEYRQVDQDFRLVDLKMGLTFPDRRKDIVQDGNSLSEIIKEYPFLQDRRQVLCLSEVYCNDQNTE